MARLDVSDLNCFWSLSPDGTRFAFGKSASHTVAIYSLVGAESKKVHIKDWEIDDLNFIADGNGFLINSLSRESSTLLYANLHGEAHPLLQQQGTFDVTPIMSRDGRHVAFSRFARNSNVWLLEPEHSQ